MSDKLARRKKKKTFGSIRKELRNLRKKLEMLRANPMRIGPSIEEKKIEERIIELNYREEVM